MTDRETAVLDLELHQEVGRRTGLSPLAYPFLVAILYAASPSSSWPPLLWIAGALLAPVAVARTIVARRLALGSANEARDWRTYGTFTIITAGLWGFFAAGILLSFGLDRLSMVLLIINSGLAGAAIGTLSLSFPLARAFYLLQLGTPTLATVALWPHDTPDGPILTCLIGLYLVAMRGLSRRLATSYRQGQLDRARLTRQSEELVRARQAAEAAMEAKSAFLATMSHEIRTPLNGVLGMAALLRDSPLNQEQRDQVTILSSSGESLLTVLNDILDYSKLEAGRVEFESIAFDPVRILEEVAALLAPTAHAGGLEFATVVDPDVPALLVGDPVRIRQVLLNLAGNAVKFTESGGITLELTATDAPVGVRFAVVDTGCGIPEAQRHRLFQAFSQLDASTTRKHGGTGLGLVISHGLVHGMGGTLEVDSTPGAGSTFVAWLPLAAASEGEPDPRTVRGERPGPVRVPLESTWERVVVVDPWPDNRRAVRGLLAPTSIELREVASPRSLRREDLIPSAHTLILIRSEDRTALEETLADLDLEVTTVVTVTTGTPERLGAHPAMRRVVRPLRRASLERLFRDESTEEVVSTEPRRAPGTRGHVLVVEDNVVNQKLALMVLQRAGFTSSVAVNGREALDRLRAADEPFDAVIMDCQMPVMDGFEATGRIREGEAGTGSHLPILAMTANSTPEDRQRCLDAGMDDYLTKPFRPDALIEVLERIVGRAAA